MSERLPSMDLFTVPLDRVCLIEASAGTGKTWTIAGLYLRLVLEAGIAPSGILVVTYTRAATAELRERVRRRLVAMRDALRGKACGDPVCERLIEGAREDIGEGEMLARITRAVLGFDEAAIYTIHGFCQRVLTESAFASGAPFDTELLPDESALLREVVEDFWRRELYAADAVFVRHLLEHARLTPDALAAELTGRIGKPYLAVRAPEGVAAGALVALRKAFEEARATWSGAREAILALLADPALKANVYRPAAVRRWAGEMRDWFDSGETSTVVPECLGRFTGARLAAATKKGQQTPTHVFFEQCTRLESLAGEAARELDARVQELRLRLLRWAQRELPARKRARRRLAYDDLLVELAGALQGRGGEVLAARLRARYPAALIDEFQDTDPVQYEVFRRVYAGGERPCFLVGDPKQAIYSFRGADVFAYLRGRADAGVRYGLARNWRSTKTLITAVNALFSRAPRPFVMEQIGFQPASAAPHERPALVEPRGGAPLRLWFVPRDGQAVVSKGDATPRIAAATAAEIVRLLDLGVRGAARLGERPLAGGDVAVLVRTHGQGLQVAEALRALGVPSVQQAGENVFHTREAMELERLLMAVAQPAREPLVRAALATEMLGRDATALEALRDDQAAASGALDALAERFDGWHRIWRERGFGPMLRAILEQEQVARRLLARPDGERRMTNLLHLADLLQAGPVMAGAGMGAVVKWLAARRAEPGTGDEEHELRLESDEHLVQILTVHRSKGLEYPVVFCPFLWDGRLRAPDAGAVVFHDPDDGMRAVLDLGSAAQARGRALAAREELAESVRLLYVALTRARNRCYVVWGAMRDAATSPLAWLLHPPPAGGEDDTQRLHAHVTALDDTAMRADLAALAQAAGGAVDVADMPAGTGEPFCPPRPDARGLAARRVRGPVHARRVLASFSSLARGHAADTPDHDAGTTLADGAGARAGEAAGRRDIHAFPRGARAGTCLHAVLEAADFTATERASLEILARGQLQAHGLGTEWAGVVADMVLRVCATTLLPGGPVLAEVPCARRLVELEFHYPVAGLDGRRLARLAARHGIVGLPSFAPLDGYLKGYVDLVFEHGGRWWLADWKSNWLGPGTGDYAAGHLEAVMIREGYHLQYLVYTLAVHRMLALRVPGYDYERHFGGVLYLFLRGIEPARGPTCGVYHARPPLALVEAIGALMDGG